MPNSRLGFRWYWLLEFEVLSCIAWGLMLGSLFVLPDYRWFIAVFVIVVGLNVGVWAGVKTRERLGAHRTDPPKYFRVFWLCVLAAEAVAGAILNGNREILMHLVGAE